MAPRQKAKPKRKSPKGTDKKQSERFKEAARTLGADMSIEDFKRAFQTIVPPKRRGS